MLMFTKKKSFDVQTTSFTEILLIILFILILFNFKSIETIDIKEKKISELIEQNNLLQKKVNEQNSEIKKLKIEIDKLKDEVIYWKRFAGAKISDLISKNLELEKKVKKYEDKYGKDNGKRTDKSVNYCRVDGNDIFVLDIFANKDFYEISPIWDEKFRSYILTVPGLNKFMSKSKISRQEFRKIFGNTYRWGNKQDPKCRFKVKLFIDTKEMSTSKYDQLLLEVDRHFWKLRVK